jgi:hypothetical protein
VKPRQNKDFFQLAKKRKLAPPPVSISSEGLLAKSKLQAKRSLEAKASGDEAECQLWAAGALELLAKAQLAGIHSSLVVDVENTNSLLEANGVSTGTRVRTVSATVAYARLKHTVAGFTTPVHDECRKLAERRNAELHSGEAACASVPMSAWEGDFWNAAETILVSMGMDLAEWLGADSKAPEHLLKAYRQAKRNAAKQRVKQHQEAFDKTPEGKLKGKKFTELVAGTGSKSPEAESRNFHYLYSKYWHRECPACETMAVVAGDLDWEETAQEQSGAEPGYEIVDRMYTPEELYCPTCKLSLVGMEALDAAGMDDGFEETVEQEMRYEPEYGND